MDLFFVSAVDSFIKSAHTFEHLELAAGWVPDAGSRGEQGRPPRHA